MLFIGLRVGAVSYMFRHVGLVKSIKACCVVLVINSLSFTLYKSPVYIILFSARLTL